MSVDDETIARIRQKLDEAERVDAGRIELAHGDDHVRLRGSVSTPEEATVAAMVAEEELAPVQNQLQVDPGLRAVPDQSQTEQPAEPGGVAADTTVEDSEAAVAENLPWDPPDAPQMAPTPTEERGALSRDAAESSIAPEEQAEDAGEPSASDLSAEELRRAAHADEAGDDNAEEA